MAQMRDVAMIAPTAANMINRPRIRTGKVSGVFLVSTGKEPDRRALRTNRPTMASTIMATYRRNEPLCSTRVCHTARRLIPLSFAR